MLSILCAIFFILNWKEQLKLKWSNGFWFAEGSGQISIKNHLKKRISVDQEIFKKNWCCSHCTGSYWQTYQWAVQWKSCCIKNEQTFTFVSLTSSVEFIIKLSEWIGGFLGTETNGLEIRCIKEQVGEGEANLAVNLPVKGRWIGMCNDWVEFILILGLRNSEQVFPAYTLGISKMVVLLGGKHANIQFFAWKLDEKLDKFVLQQHIWDCI